MMSAYRFGKVIEVEPPAPNLSYRIPMPDGSPHRELVRTVVKFYRGPVAKPHPTLKEKYCLWCGALNHGNAQYHPGCLEIKNKAEGK